MATATAELQGKQADRQAGAGEGSHGVTRGCVGVSEERERAAQAAAKDKEEPEGLPSPPSTPQAPADGEFSYEQSRQAKPGCVRGWQGRVVTWLCCWCLVQLMVGRRRRRRSR